MCALSRQAGRRFPAGGMTPHAESRKVSPFFYPLRSEMNPSNHHQGITDWMYCICTYPTSSCLFSLPQQEDFDSLVRVPQGIVHILNS